MGSDLQVQARAMGDPTRHAIFRHVVDSRHPVGVAELTDLLGFNHNAIRQHLAKLVNANLLRESTAPASGPGRPRLVYSAHPAANSRWGAIGPYQRLSSLLADVIRTGESPVEVGRRSVTSAPKSLDPIDAMCASMAEAGFEPRIECDDEGVQIVLDRCPFVATAVSDPDTVCQLHLGMAEGVAERVGRMRVDELVVNDPRRARCRLRVRLENDERPR